MAAHQSKKLRRSAEDLLRRTGMSTSSGGAAESMQLPMPGVAGGGAAGPTAQPFAHHAAGDRRGQWTGSSRLAAAHDLVPGHRHRGAEQHSALSGR